MGQSASGSSGSALEGPAERGERRPQCRITDPAHDGGDLVLFGAAQAGAPAGQRVSAGSSHRRLNQMQPGDRGIAEEAVDPLQHLGLAVLQLERGAAGDMQRQDAAPMPGPVGQAYRLGAGSKIRADDGRPFGQQPGLGEAAPARRRVEDAAEQIRQPAQATAPAHLLLDHPTLARRGPTLAGFPSWLAHRIIRQISKRRLLRIGGDG